VNAALVGVGLLDRPAQLLFNWGSVLVVLAHTFLPFQVLAIMGVVVQIDPALEQAAASLRASRWTIFRRVVIPMAFPGILAGSTIVFMLTISAFVTPRVIGGTRVQMHGSLIYEQMIVVLNWSFAAAMSVVLLALSVGVPALANRATRRAKRPRPVALSA
jgi:putative spermidine/putrescine transport system permease protein